MQALSARRCQLVVQFCLNKYSEQSAAATRHQVRCAMIDDINNAYLDWWHGNKWSNTLEEKRRERSSLRRRRRVYIKIYFLLAAARAISAHRIADKWRKEWFDFSSSSSSGDHSRSHSKPLVPPKNVYDDEWSIKIITLETYRMRVEWIAMMCGDSFSRMWDSSKALFSPDRDSWKSLVKYRRANSSERQRGQGFVPWCFHYLQVRARARHEKSF